MLSTEICSILHMLRKPNSLIALLFIQNNSKFKNMAETYLPASKLNSSSIVYVEVCPVPQVFSKEQMSPPELSSCCFCHVFSYYSSCSSYSWQEWNVRHFFFHNQNNSTSSPGPLGNGALRADVSKYRPEVYKSEKSKILKKIHKVALGKILT